MPIPSTIPSHLAPLCTAFTNGLLDLLGGKLHGFYLYGAAMFPESEATGDVDAHAILTEPLTGEEKAGIDLLYADLGRRFPPLGADLDVYFLLLEEAKQAGTPTHQLDPSIVDSSWALHRAHMLAGRCAVLHGPQPSDIFPKPTWEEIEQALAGELDYVIRHTSQYPDYCILNLCRLMYSYQTRDVVVSKFGSATWASSEYPQWAELIALARKSYVQGVTDEERAIMLSEVESLLAFAQAKISEFGGHST